MKGPTVIPSTPGKGLEGYGVRRSKGHSPAAWLVLSRGGKHKGVLGGSSPLDLFWDYMEPHHNTAFSEELSQVTRVYTALLKE